MIDDKKRSWAIVNETFHYPSSRKYIKTFGRCHKNVKHVFELKKNENLCTTLLIPSIIVENYQETLAIR